MSRTECKNPNTATELYRQGGWVARTIFGPGPGGPTGRPAPEGVRISGLAGTAAGERLPAGVPPQLGLEHLAPGVARERLLTQGDELRDLEVGQAFPGKLNQVGRV